MTSFLIEHFVSDPENTSNSLVRQAYGKLSSLIGIFANLLLFIGKFSVGTLFHSISIAADGMNNLSDAGSSVISLFSFYLSGKPADSEHPFGHARYEYIASMLVSVLIFLLGLELGRSSIEKIIHPELPEFHLLTAVILIASILVKLWLYRFNRHLGQKIDSPMLAATAADSLSDVLATTAVLVSSLLSPLLHYSLDGWMGAVVALLILRAGWEILQEALDKLLGECPSEELVHEIRAFIQKYDGVLGVHDLMVHNYGPGRTFASAHVEVSASQDVMVSHDKIDNLEHDIQKELGIALVVHMDPIETDNPLIQETRTKLIALIAQLDPTLSIHDFRMVIGESHSNLVFDLLVPYSCSLPTYQLSETIQKAVQETINPTYFTIIHFDRSYVSSPKS